MVQLDTARAWLGGGVLWLVAAVVGAGAGDGTARFYVAEAIWLAAHLLFLAGLVGLGRIGARSASLCPRGGSC